MLYIRFIDTNRGWNIMKIILNSIFFILILFVGFTVYYTLVYLRNEYRKAISAYKKRQEAQRNYFNSQKVKSKVDTDIRRLSDNRQIGHARFTFEREGHHSKRKGRGKERLEIVGVIDGDININNLVASSERCLFIKVNNKFLICDLFKTNKILLNGVPINNACEIKYGDFVEIGKIMFQFNNILFVA